MGHVGLSVTCLVAYHSVTGSTPCNDPGGKLFSHRCLCYEAVYFGIGISWEANGKSCMHWLPRPGTLGSSIAVSRGAEKEVRKRIRYTFQMGYCSFTFASPNHNQIQRRLPPMYNSAIVPGNASLMPGKMRRASLTVLIEIGCRP